MKPDFDYNAAANAIGLVHIPTLDEMKNSTSVCHVCLKRTKLTKEHIPPRKAFNFDNKLWDLLNLKDGKKRPFLARGGLWVQTLCKKCNNEVCSPYANEYIKFIKNIVESPKLLANDRGSKYINCLFKTQYIAKEIATMILAIEPVEFAEKHYELRKFVLEANYKIVPPMKIYAFLVHDDIRAGTISRFHAKADVFAKDYGFAGGEISNYPFGFIYATRVDRGYQVDRLTDISSWFSEENVNATSFYTRLTGTDSVNSVINGRRRRPQIDYLYKTTNQEE